MINQVKRLTDPNRSKKKTQMWSLWVFEDTIRDLEAKLQVHQDIQPRRQLIHLYTYSRPKSQ